MIRWSVWGYRVVWCGCWGCWIGKGWMAYGIEGRSGQMCRGGGAAMWMVHWGCARGVRDGVRYGAVGGGGGVWCGA